MFIFHLFHFSQSHSCRPTAQIHLEYLFMFPSIPLFPTFTVIYPLSVSASVSETPIYSNSIPYRTAHSLWNKVFFSTAVLWTADTPFSPTPHYHHHHHHHFDHGPLICFSWVLHVPHCVLLWEREIGLCTAHWVDVVMSAV